MKKASLCPSCGSDIEGETVLEAEAEKPLAGDYAICAECLAWVRYKKVKRHLELELITDSEILNRTIKKAAASLTA